jgi:hypothetical protein
MKAVGAGAYPRSQAEIAMQAATPPLAAAVSPKPSAGYHVCAFA